MDWIKDIFSIKIPKLIDIARPILCFYNLMLTIFAFLMLIYEISFMDRCKCKCRKMFSTSKLFLVLVMMHQGLRLIFNFVPMRSFLFFSIPQHNTKHHFSFYIYLYRNRPWGLAAQNVLDLTPEILFILTYTVILLSWIEFFFYLFLVVRQNKITKSSGIVNLPFFGVVILGTLMFLVVLAESLVIGIFPQLCKDYSVLSRIQGITLSATSVTFSATFFFLYFILILAFCPFRKLWGGGLVETKAIQRTLLVITLTAFLYFIFLIFRVVWILILNDLIKGWVKANVVDEYIFHIAWILYMCSEEIPMTLMLGISYFFRAFFGSKRLKLKEGIKLLCFRTPCCSCCYSLIWGNKYDVISQIPELAVETSSIQENANKKQEDGQLPDENENENDALNDNDSSDQQFIQNKDPQIDSHAEWIQNLYLNVNDINAADEALEREKKRK